MSRRVPCVLMRGGTSRGPFLLAADLPADAARRDAVLMKIMGSPDPLQLDGLGGAKSLTSKVAIVSPSQEPGADVDYLFAQVKVHEARVDTKPNCGNMLSGVGPFAIEAGLVAARDPVTVVRIFNVNTRTPRRSDRPDAGRPRAVRGRHAHRRRARARSAGQAELPRRDGRDDRSAAADRQRRRRDRRRRGELRRHGDAGRDHVRGSARQERRRDARGARSRPRAVRAPRRDPRSGGSDHGPGRRRQDGGAETGAGLAAAQRRQHHLAVLHAAHLPPVARRHRRAGGRHGRGAARLRREPLRRAARPRREAPSPSNILPAASRSISTSPDPPRAPRYAVPRSCGPRDGSSKATCSFPNRCSPDPTRRKSCERFLHPWRR